MPYTTQGYMTAADMADLADLYDWNCGLGDPEPEPGEYGEQDEAWHCPCCESGHGAAMDPAGAREACEMCGHCPSRHA